MARIGVPHYSPDPGIATVAALIGDPARAAMLSSLLDGRELSAGELAYRANVAPNSASVHLAKLLAGGLLRARAQGRQRFFALSGAAVAHAIESLSVIAPPANIVALTQARISGELRDARTCYDHLAGRLGVAVTDVLVRREVIMPSRGLAYKLTQQSRAFFSSLEIDLDEVERTRRHFARQCIDWSERRAHLAGALGAAICDRFLANGWVERLTSSRALRVTPSGHAWLRATLGIDSSR